MSTSLALDHEIDGLSQGQFTGASPALDHEIYGSQVQVSS